MAELELKLNVKSIGDETFSVDVNTGMMVENLKSLLKVTRSASCFLF